MNLVQAYTVENAIAKTAIMIHLRLASVYGVSDMFPSNSLDIA